MAECPYTDYDGALVGSLNTTLSQIFNGTFDDDSRPTTLSALYCALAGSGMVTSCLGICANPDITGLGVRISNYVQSFLNAIVIYYSPDDSNLTSWSATLLTMAVVIPAIYQKSQHSLSVYHATQVLNFATISSICNLAAAPMCSIWRQARKGIIKDPGEEWDNEAGFTGDEALYGRPTEEERLHQLQETKAVTSRITISFALIAQICIQWAWAIYMFTSPEYFQTPCSPLTTVVFFGAPLTVQQINEHTFFIFPLWLLFHMSITLLWGALLVFSSSLDAHPLLSTTPSYTTYLEIRLAGRVKRSWILMRERILALDRKRTCILTSNVTAGLVAVFLMVSSEFQEKSNCILLGDSITGFGQIAAVLLDLVPVGVLIAAYTKKHQEKDELPTTTPTASLSDFSDPGIRDNTGKASAVRHIELLQLPRRASHRAQSSMASIDEVLSE